MNHIGKVNVNNLIPYSDYSREDIHDIFSPETNFTPGAGYWGIQGVIKIPNRPGDFIFIVSYGSSQAGHYFDEPITQDGVITWQSQPSKLLRHSEIRQLISHDELTNSIYLFLRTKPDRKYTYLGNLSYISHDKEREAPVWFHWQILDWNIPTEVLGRMELTLAGEQPPPPAPSGITITELPEAQSRGSRTRNFKGGRSAHNPGMDAKNKKLGNAGELLVVEQEKMKLKQAGHPDLAERVIHVAKTEGDGAGYDVLSYTDSGEEKYIEVKTTRAGKNTDFFITSNEIAFSKFHADSFYLYRLYNFNETSASMYVIRGDMNEVLKLDALNYRANVL